MLPFEKITLNDIVSEVHDGTYLAYQQIIWCTNDFTKNL